MKSGQNIIFVLLNVSKILSIPVIKLQVLYLKMFNVRRKYIKFLKFNCLKLI